MALGKSALLLLMPFVLPGALGCSVRSYATRTLADTFAASGTGYASEDDPELVREAVPFALKTMEQILDEQPTHVGLLTALASGFTQYAYAFIVEDADEVEDVDMARSQRIRRRARRLLLRARDYGLRGLDARHPGFAAAFKGGAAADRDRLIAATTKEDVALLYWTAAAWALAVSNAKDTPEIIGQLPMVEPLIARALAVDETFDGGAIHEFYVSYDAARAESDGGGPAKARQHLDRALALGQNKKLGALVSYAEAVTVASQDKAEFTRMLEQVLAADADKDPPHRLANLVAQRRARWLLSRTADLFAN